MRRIRRILQISAAMLISCTVAVSASIVSKVNLDISVNYASKINYTAVSVKAVNINSPPVSKVAQVKNVASISVDVKNIALAINYKVLNLKKGAHLIGEKSKSAPSLFTGNSIRILPCDNRA